MNSDTFLVIKEMVSKMTSEDINQYGGVLLATAVLIHFIDEAFKYAQTQEDKAHFLKLAEEAMDKGYNLDIDYHTSKMKLQNATLS